jgi:hypothetical protein
MAVQPRELVDTRPRPQLRLVPAETATRHDPARPPGRPIAAVLLVVLIGAAISLPVARAALEDPPPVPRFAPRPAPAVEIDPGPLPILPRPSWPRGPSIAGIAFVRCTSLWVSDTDGSDAHRIVALKGLSSPAFAPDARTIGFIQDGRELWMVGSDGSDARRVATLDLSPDAYATGLAWSENGKSLAFAVVTPYYDPWIDGSAIFTYRLDDGEVQTIGAGWPAPTWIWRHVAFARRGADQGIDVTMRGRDRQLSTRRDDLAAVQIPSGWESAGYKRGLVIVRRNSVVVRRDTWSRKTHLVAKPPLGYDIYHRARPAISQDGERAFIELTDARGTPALGVLDTKTGEWSVVGYAWDPTASPAPAVHGPLDRRRVLFAAQDLLSAWNWRPRRAALLMGTRRDEELFGGGRYLGFSLGAVSERDGRWTVDGVVNWSDKKWSYREVQVEVDKKGHRLTARPSAVEPVQRVETISDAIEFLRTAIGPNVVAPTWLPQGTHFARDVANAWSWGGSRSGSIYLKAPGEGHVTLAYGDVDLSMGCGGVNDPEEVSVAGTTGVMDHVSPTRQVVWPATLKARDTAFFSVYGDVDRATLLRIAASIEDAR